MVLNKRHEHKKPETRSKNLTCPLRRTAGLAVCLPAVPGEIHYAVAERPLRREESRLPEMREQEYREDRHGKVRGVPARRLIS
jgi:hypothetical protein